MQMRPDAACISLAEDQIEHVQNCGQSSSPLVRRRESEWYARSLNGCFARVILCAIVASGTRKALAISAVVKPPTARNVSPIAEDGESAG